MGHVIRKARQDDYVDLCILCRESDSLHRRLLPRVFRTARGQARTKAYVRAILSDKQAALFVAERGGRIVGFAHVRVRAARRIPILVPGRYAVVEDLVVRKRARRRGIGR
ncbi:MAG: GNAT family N-acetyltransferase [Planctomycetes bacterium]|nr:GNAT family N-acetyltransferase [Planctomycetota bacterium]